MDARPQTSNRIGVPLWILALTIALTWACSNGDECRGPADCPGGMICKDARCVRHSASPTISGGGDRCAGSAVAEIEPANNDPLDAPRLPLGRTVAGRIGPPSDSPDSDYFVFEAEAGQTMSFRVFPCPPDSKIDPIIEVGDLASAGMLFDRQNDDDGESSASYLEVFFYQAGWYFLRTDEYDNRLGGAAVGGDDYGYRLVTHLLAPPRDALPFESQQVQINLQPGRLRFFSLRTETTALLYATLTGHGMANPALTLVDAASGQPLDFNDNRSDCPGSADARVGGCLYDPALLVVDGIGLGGHQAELTLQIEASENLPDAGNTAGRLPYPGGAAIYRLPEPQGNLIRLSAASDDFSPALELMSCSGGSRPATHAIGRAGDPAAAAIERLGTDDNEGVMFGRVNNRAALDDPCSAVSEGPLEFSFEAGSSDLDPAIPDHLPDFDWTPPRQGALGAFAISVNKRQTLTISASPLPGSASTPYLMLEPASLTGALTRSSGSVDDPGKTVRLRWFAANGEQFVLLVGDRYGGGGPGFGIALSIESADFNGRPVNEQSDPNDDPATAQALDEPPLLVTAKLDPAAGDRIDYFSVPVAVGQQLSVRSWAADDSQVPDTVVSLLTIDGQVLTFNDDRGPDLLSAPPALPARYDGRLLIAVELRGQQPADYLLEIVCEPVAAGEALRPLPGDLVVNEILIDPGGFDVSGDGLADDGDQFVELINAGPYKLDMGGVVVWGPGGYLLFPAGAALDAGRAAVLFNGVADPDLFLSEVFSGGSSVRWLGSGPRALMLSAPGGAGYSPEPLADLSVPATAAAGESVNRLTDGDSTRILRPHSHVVGSIGLRSPGSKVDGEPFR